MTWHKDNLVSHRQDRLGGQVGVLVEQVVRREAELDAREGQVEALEQSILEVRARKRQREEEQADGETMPLSAQDNWYTTPPGPGSTPTRATYTPTTGASPPTSKVSGRTLPSRPPLTFPTHPVVLPLGPQAREQAAAGARGCQQDQR